MKHTLQQALVILAKVRKALTERKKDKVQAHSDMLASEEGQVYQFAEREVKNYTSREKAVKAIVDKLTIEAYDGENKQVTKGASVTDKPIKRPVYDKAKATAWIEEKASALLQPDWAAFDSMVLGGLVPEEVAQVEEVPNVKARIATNLSFLLEADDDATEAA